MGQEDLDALMSASVIWLAKTAPPDPAVFHAASKLGSCKRSPAK